MSVDEINVEKYNQYLFWLLFYRIEVENSGARTVQELAREEMKWNINSAHQQPNNL